MFHVFWDGWYLCAYGVEELSIIFNCLIDQGIKKDRIIVFKENERFLRGGE